MTELARWLAPRVWFVILRFMRLPVIRRIRRGWMRRIPEPTRLRMIRQDRFARRYGLAVLQFSLTLMLASFAITGSYFVALWLVNAGILVQPQPR